VKAASADAPRVPPTVEAAAVFRVDLFAVVASSDQPVAANWLPVFPRTDAPLMAEMLDLYGSTLRVRPGSYAVLLRRGAGDEGWFITIVAREGKPRVVAVRGGRVVVWTPGEPGEERRQVRHADRGRRHRDRPRSRGELRSGQRHEDVVRREERLHRASLGNGDTGGSVHPGHQDVSQVPGLLPGAGRVHLRAWRPGRTPRGPGGSGLPAAAPQPGGSRASRPWSWPTVSPWPGRWWRRTA